MHLLPSRLAVGETKLATVLVPTLDGKVELNIKPGTQPGDIFKLHGKGIPRPYERGKGDQLVRIVVEIPKSLTEHEKQLLTELEKDLNVKRGAPVGSGKKSNLRDKFEKRK